MKIDYKCTECTGSLDDDNDTVFTNDEVANNQVVTDQGITLEQLFFICL